MDIMSVFQYKKKRIGKNSKIKPRLDKKEYKKKDGTKIELILSLIQDMSSCPKDCKRIRLQCGM